MHEISHVIIPAKRYIHIPSTPVLDISQTPESLLCFSHILISFLLSSLLIPRLNNLPNAPLQLPPPAPLSNIAPSPLQHPMLQLVSTPSNQIPHNMITIPQQGSIKLDMMTGCLGDIYLRYVGWEDTDYFGYGGHFEGCADTD